VPKSIAFGKLGWERWCREFEKWVWRGVKSLEEMGWRGCRSLFKKRWKGAAGTRTSKRSH